MARCAHNILRSAFCVLRSAFCVLRISGWRRLVVRYIVYTRGGSDPHTAEPVEKGLGGERQGGSHRGERERDDEGKGKGGLGANLRCTKRKIAKGG